MPIASEGFRLSVAFSAIALLFHHLLGFGLVAGVLWILAIFVVSFFRDPEREIPLGRGLVLSPADGTIIRIQEVDEPRFIQGRAWMVGIFMSPFNCHVNRFPISGHVRHRTYIPGEFLAAFEPKASELNEQNILGIQGSEIKVLVRQIAGFLARRIVCHVDLGDSRAIGERFGLIQFGSRCDVFLPLGVAPRVKLGDRVKAGLTVLARVPESNA
ncbi:MAG: phosphatidylserine decarboxylase family protein [Candidatus Riflebacteria bacterium]|nr:phosphatidylserine decarboxylase family protein [Candidatus Riflebacteria bacterium]